MQIICESPNIILNPSLPRLVSKYRCVHLGNEVIRYKGTYLDFVRLDTRKFYNIIDIVTPDNLDDFVVVDESTGETFNVFLCVPCNECVLCKNRKCNSFVQRCRMESQLYDCVPWFCTLTYNDNWLPVDGLSVREVQLFVKRFRINLERHGYFDRIRYVIVGEYGRKTHRAHYHAIFWNLHPNIFNDYETIKNIMAESWHYGYIKSRLIDMSNDKSFYYTSKYMKKECVVPEGCNKPFMLCSLRDGSIGAPFIDKLKTRLHHTLNTSFKYLDKWLNKLQEVHFDSYILNRVFPSYCKVMPSDLRVSAYKFMYYYRAFCETDKDISFLFTNTKNYVQNCVLPFIGLPHGDTFRVAIRDLSKDSRNFGILFDLARKLERFRVQGISVEHLENIALRSQEVRNKFLGRLFLYAQPVDIAQLGYSVRNRFSRSKSLEVL